MLFICLVKLWILFLCVVETLVIVFGGLSAGIFTRSSELINFLMNIIQRMGMTGLVSNSRDAYCASHVFAYPSGIHGIVEFGEKSTVLITCSSFVLFIYKLWRC